VRIPALTASYRWVFWLSTVFDFITVTPNVIAGMTIRAPMMTMTSTRTRMEPSSRWSDRVSVDGWPS
jgi:hypothetical protein